MVTLLSEDSGLLTDPIRQVEEIAGMCVKATILKTDLLLQISALHLQFQKLVSLQHLLRYSSAEGLLSPGHSACVYVES